MKERSSITLRYLKRLPSRRRAPICSCANSLASHRQLSLPLPFASNTKSSSASIKAIPRITTGTCDHVSYFGIYTIVTQLTDIRLIPKADRKKIHEYLFRGMSPHLPSSAQTAHIAASIHLCSPSSQKEC